jgi:hypothetical protein
MTSSLRLSASSSLRRSSHPIRDYLRDGFMAEQSNRESVKDLQPRSTTSGVCLVIDVFPLFFSRRVQHTCEHLETVKRLNLCSDIQSRIRRFNKLPSSSPGEISRPDPRKTYNRKRRLGESRRRVKRTKLGATLHSASIRFQ